MAADREHERDSQSDAGPRMPQGGGSDAAPDTADAPETPEDGGAQAPRKLERPRIYSANRRHPRTAARNRQDIPPAPQPEGDGEWKDGSEPDPDDIREITELSRGQKAFYFIGGFLFGLIGIIFIFLLNLRRHPDFRSASLCWAGLGLIVAFVMELVVLNSGVDVYSMLGVDAGTAGTVATTGTDPVF